MTKPDGRVGMAFRVRRVRDNTARFRLEAHGASNNSTFCFHLKSAMPVNFGAKATFVNS
jgi:hypothetical protein